MSKKIGKKIINGGHLVRVGSALGTGGAAASWYNGVKDYAVNQVIDTLGSDLTYAIDEVFCLYGIGEGIAAVGQVREEKENDIKPHLLEYSGRVARLAPIATPIISQATDGDFVKSVLIPAGVCVLGWGVEYVGRFFRKENDIKMG
ncbi:MAG: hypothetical protein JSW41_00040 [Candidatus Aenigmatarchaeota archaeon]|nr:MAG: hypothetical protein JSW41_00040 [Candidatus Aenigmarchaeota archaeon]